MGLPTNRLRCLFLLRLPITCAATLVACSLSWGQVPGVSSISGSGTHLAPLPAVENVASASPSAPQAPDYLLSLLGCRQQGNTLHWLSDPTLRFVLSSEKNSPDFHIEYFTSTPILGRDLVQRRYGRFQFEHANGMTASAHFGLHNLPSIFVFGNRHYVLQHFASWGFHPSHRWGFVVDGLHQSNYFDAAAANPNAAALVRVDLADLIRQIMSGHLYSVRWHPFMRVLSIETANGARITARFRTPNDTIRYGAALAEVWLSASNSAVDCFRAFQTVPSERTRLHLANFEKRFDEHAKEITPNAVPELAVSVDNAERIAASETLWEQLSNYRRADYKELIQRDKELFLAPNLKLRVSTIAMVIMIEAVPEDKIASDKKTTELLGLFATSYFREVLEAINKKIPHDEPFPDDSAMIWREIEAELGLRESILLYRNVGLPVLGWPLFPDNFRASLCDAIGDCGYPSFMGEGDILKPLLADPFYGAIFRSRWQWPCEPKHIEACVDALKSCRPSLGTELAAVETLVRLDSFSHIPPEALDRWYQKQVVEAKAALRRQSLTVLSLHHAGREYLFNRLVQKLDPPIVQESTLLMLKARAKATLATEQFDFMSQEECQHIMPLTLPTAVP